MKLAGPPRIALLVSSALVALFTAGCSGARGSDVETNSEYETIELRSEGFTGTVTPAELAENLGYLAPLRLKYIGSNISGPANIQNVVTGDIDFGGAFNGAVIKLKAAKAPITAVIGYYGVDDKIWSGFFVKEDSSLRKPEDLIGKKVSMNTLGAHQEFMLREYLFRHGVPPAHVTLVVVPPVNGEQALRQDHVEVSVLGSIFREKALERGGIRPLFTDLELFGPFTAGSYVMRNDFIRKNPKTARKFVEGVGRAIEWSRTTPREEVIARMTRIVEQRKRNENADALKYWRSYGVANSHGRLSDKEFQLWIDWMVREGQLEKGQIRARDLYTNEFQQTAAR